MTFSNNYTSPKRLPRSEKCLEIIFECAPDAFYLIDLNGVIVDVNRAAEEMVGYSRDELIGEKIFYMNIIPPKQLPRAVKLLNLNALEKPTGPVEFTLLRKDRTQAYVEVRTHPVKIGDGTLVLGIARDISERKTLQDGILKAKNEWEEIFNIISDAITIHDSDYNIIRANKAAMEMLGLDTTALNLKNQKCYQLYHGTEFVPNVCPCPRTLSTGEPDSAEFFEQHLKRHIEIESFPRLDKEKNVIGFVHVSKDITERKKLEAQLLQAQKMEAVGQLAGGVAHDFNNILTAIINYSYLLMNEVTKDSLKDMISQILSLSDRASNITRGLLAFSRKQYVEPKPVNLNKVIMDIGKLLGNFISEDIEFTSKLSQSELIIMADVTHLEQCIMNLFTNARDAMPDGGSLTIKTEVVKIDADFINLHAFGVPGLYTLLSVTDTGTGIDEEIRQKIFDPFYSTKEVGKGTGLGLAIVYGIIKQHKGYIDVNSEPGKGTTFRIYFPLIKANTETENEKFLPSIKGNTETILVVEDEAAVRESICKILEKFGYRVIPAVDGVDAVAKFRKHKDEIQLVILDVIMPKKNGKETYEEIKQITSGIKVIFISGYTADLIHNNKMLGKNLVFISKPVLPNELLLKIKELIGNEGKN